MTVQKLLIATLNEGKLVEFKRLLADFPWQVVSLRDFPHFEPGPETGTSFAANAMAKAVQAARALNLPTAADDSGLEVDALGGLPGIYSARFGGPELDDQGRNALLLEQLSGLPPAARTARYRIALALVPPSGSAANAFLVEGKVEGWIGTQPRGSGGFGYDPIFYLRGHGGDFLSQTMAELTAAEKDAISHRGQALRQLQALLAEKGLPAD